MPIDYTNFKDKEEIKEYVNQNPAIYYKKIKAFNRPLYDEVMLLGKKTFAENLYNYLYTNNGCQRCGIQTGFINVLEGYRPSCKACYEFMRARKELWGPPPKCNNPKCDNAAFGENAHNGQWNLHCSLKCRGVDNSIKSREKSKKTTLEKYGVEHYSMTDECKQKVINTSKERYGVENVMHIREYVDKIQSTIKDRYNVKSLHELDWYVNKKNATMMEKYGVLNPSQNLSVHKKKLRSSKKYTLKNGVTIDVQGYEPFFLDDLSKIMDVDESIVDIPTINYVHHGENKVYYPVFFVKPYNMVIEVKSKYTISTDKEMIYNKIVGSICAGYDFLLIVYGEDGKILSSMYYDENIVSMMYDIGCDDFMVDIGGVYHQYVNNGKSFNFVHGVFVCEELVGANFNKDYLNRMKSQDKSYMFTHDMVKTKPHALRNFIWNKFNRAETVYARNCEVRDVSFIDANTFLNQHHIQGGVSGGSNYGLYHDNELVSVMCFSKPRLGVGKKRDNTYELTRFCSKGNIVGGASKLLKAFTRDNEGVSIISYSDNSYSDGELYMTLGFTLENEVRPRYKYIKVGEDRVYPRFMFTKYKLKDMPIYDDGLSEKDIMNANGYVRFYDCGKKTWVLA